MSAHLLWVDDEIDLLRPHLLYLQKKGYEVTTASNGPDAIELTRENNFDLILLDENMPGLTGLDTLAQLKAIRPDLPVVMVTKNEEEDIMDQAIGSQIADYLIKPVNPTQILLTLKKNIHQQQITQQVTQTAYRQSYMQIDSQISATSTPEEWIDLYKNLTQWELQLGETVSPMNQLLSEQKEEANKAFSKFFQKNYPSWLASPAGERPLLSPDVFRRVVFPRLDKGESVTLILFDNFRYDQWRSVAPMLNEQFHIDDGLYYAIIPTATQYARNAIFSGLMPLQIKQQYPDLWVEEADPQSKNRNEAELIRQQLLRFRRKETFAYHKLNNSDDINQFIQQLPQALAHPLNVIVINFIDILSHARTESQMIRELANNEAAYRSITQSWFQNTSIKELLQKLSETPRTVILTTDHGSIRTTKPTKVVGDRNVNTNLRYKLGRNLSYNAKEVFAVTRPEQLQLPSPNLSTSYIFASGNHFLAYPNNYNYYVQYYRDTFQHGGISMEEILVPLVTLRSKSAG